jgi:hypothetical protein
MTVCNVKKQKEIEYVKYFLSVFVILSVLITVHTVLGQEENPKKIVKKKGEAISFKKDVFTIIQKQCLPCHAEEQFNPSELSLDSYESLKTGGKHGDAFVAGKAKESLLVKKLSEEPPFGDRMPLNTKKKISEGKAKWLSEEELKTIATWIDQGAKNN